jgi:hypothetical protein
MSIKSISDSVVKGLKSFLRFFKLHSNQLAAAASVAEVAVGAPELVPLTVAAGKAAQETATILEDVTKNPEPN